MVQAQQTAEGEKRSDLGPRLPGTLCSALCPGVVLPDKGTLALGGVGKATLKWSPMEAPLQAPEDAARVPSLYSSCSLVYVPKLRLGNVSVPEHVAVEMIRVKQILSPGAGGQPAARDGRPHSNAPVSLHPEGGTRRGSHQARSTAPAAP